MVGRFVREIVSFGYKQALSCVFAVAMFVLLFVSTWIPSGPLHRYDLILIGAVLTQLAMVRSGLETSDELATITLFHVVGIGLELFKTHPSIGSWAYPEPALSKVGGVPLYAGFMYAAVASFMMQSWRRLDVRLHRYPPRRLTIPLVVAIYVNFFTHHYTIDLRWWLMGAVGLVFGATSVSYVPLDRRRRMPLALGFFLIGFFIWVAENVATLLGGYQYPNQALGDWQLVHPDKIGSWFILAILSFVMVAELKRWKSRRPSGSNAHGAVVDTEAVSPIE